MLDNLQLDQIADPQARELIRRLMNLVEQLSAENQQLRESAPTWPNCLPATMGSSAPRARP